MGVDVVNCTSNINSQYRYYFTTRIYVFDYPNYSPCTRRICFRLSKLFAYPNAYNSELAKGIWIIKVELYYAIHI